MQTLNLELSGIYRITNIINKKIYIGSSKCLKDRFYQHSLELRNNTHYNPYLQNSWNKYGEDSFLFEVVEIVDEFSSLQDREQHWLDKTKSYIRSNGYNILEKAYSFQGYKHSEETRKRMSVSRKGKPNNITYTDELRHRMRMKKLGGTLTKEHKLKISKSQLGKRKYSVLTSDEVKNIRLLLRDTTLSQTEISYIFKIDRTNIKHIKENRTWKDVLITSNDNLPEELLTLSLSIENNRKPKKNNTKLDNHKVRIIKLLLRDTKLFQKEIASLFNVGRKAITKINQGERWADVLVTNEDTLESNYLTLANEIIERR